MPAPEITWIYECNDVKFVRKDKPEAWTTLDKANGAMFRSYPMFSFIPGTKGNEEPVRFGPLVFDIDTGEQAVEDAKRIIAWFEAVYSVDPEQWSIFLSGKKGVHLELSADIIGTADGHTLLPLAYKRLAKDVEGELGVKLDTSMYNTGTGKPYRQPNIMRDTGTCKRQIKYDDLFEISNEEEYRMACAEPGPTWGAEDNTPSKSLAEKLKTYLADAVVHEEAIRNAPKMTQDDQDRLGIGIPPCVHVLANLTHPGASSATFNDVAIQLTAYAISTGRTEAEFIGGCLPFLMGYPSSSLNTPEKRLENARARFRTMSTHGYQHSCWGVKSLRIAGFVCGDCAFKGVQEKRVEVMSREDLEQTSGIGLEIPEHILMPGGIINDGVIGLQSAGLPPIPQYAFPVVMAAIARAISGKISIGDLGPNLYCLKVGPTSTGKSQADKRLASAIRKAGIKNFIGFHDFSSGVALFRGLQTHPQTLLVIDEATSLFKRYDGRGGGDPITDGKRNALLEAFSASGDYTKQYGDKKNIIEVSNVCLSVLGNATTTIFDAISMEDFETGTMQRFDFFVFDGKAQYPGKIGPNPRLDAFVAGLHALMTATKAAGDGNLLNIVPGAVDIGFTGDAEALRENLSIGIIDQVNSIENAGQRGIIHRKYHLSIKYAMAHAAGTRPASALFCPLDASDMQWGIAVADMLAGWKIKTLCGQVTAGEYHRKCEVFKKAIAAAVLAGRKPTFNMLVNRRPEIKNWTRKESEDVIWVLEKRGEIVKNNSGPRTTYHLSAQSETDTLYKYEK